MTYRQDTCQAEPIRKKNITQKEWTYNSILLATQASKRVSSRLFERASGFKVSLIPPRIFSVPRKARNTSEYRITDRNEAMSIYPQVNFMSNIILQKEKFVVPEEDATKIGSCGIPIVHRKSIQLRRTHVHETGES
jgi:hypothetical protein